MDHSRLAMVPKQKGRASSSLALRLVRLQRSVLRLNVLSFVVFFISQDVAVHNDTILDRNMKANQLPMTEMTLAP